MLIIVVLVMSDGVHLADVTLNVPGTSLHDLWENGDT